MWVAVALIAISLLGLAISLYFMSLLYPLPAWLTRALARAAKACSIDGGSCKRVVQTPYARIFGGAPNMIIGTLWSVAVIAQSAVFLATGTFPLWSFSVFVSLASVAVGFYLTIVLFFVLKDPCPL